MIKYNKLVRDKIPEIIASHGETPNVSVLDEQRYIEELNKKLNEEVQEYQESKDTEELADILEIIYSICDSKGITFQQLQEIRIKKQNERGGFSKRLFLISKD